MPTCPTSEGHWDGLRGVTADAAHPDWRYRLLGGGYRVLPDLTHGRRYVDINLMNLDCDRSPRTDVAAVNDFVPRRLAPRRPSLARPGEILRWRQDDRQRELPRLG